MFYKKDHLCFVSVDKHDGDFVVVDGKEYQVHFDDFHGQEYGTAYVMKDGQSWIIDN